MPSRNTKLVKLASHIRQGDPHQVKGFHLFPPKLAELQFSRGLASRISSRSSTTSRGNSPLLFIARSASTSQS